MEGIKMRISFLSILLLLILVLPATPQTPSGMPLMRSVEPGSGRVGDVLTAQGANLGPDDVAVLYLTDGKIDLKATIIDQTSTSITFRIPPEAKPGRFALMVLTIRGNDRKLIEQPVRIVVEPQVPSPTTS
jgi:hypothetical protein